MGREGRACGIQQKKSPTAAEKPIAATLLQEQPVPHAATLVIISEARTSRYPNHATQHT